MNLIKKYLLASSYYGKFILLIGLLILVPIIILPFFPEEIGYAPSFIIPSGISILLGIAVCIILPNEEDNFSDWHTPVQKGSVPVLFAWCYGSVLGSIPFILADKLTPILALFESVSGWTTTGLTVVKISEMPYIFLFHRSFMQYCGGLGFIIMIVMLVYNKQSMNLYSAEGHPEKIMPRLKETAQTIFFLYSGFLVLGTILYVVFGMSIFDAVCHTMSALSTAGFSTKEQNIGAYNSVGVDIVSIILMLVGSTNFAVLLLAVKGKLRQFFKVSEIKVLIGILVIFIPLTALSLITCMGMDIGSAMRNAAFGVVTIFSTTGFSTMDYSIWPPFAIGLLIILMIVGGSTGSTAGGIKLSRTCIMLKTIKESFQRRLNPANNVTTLHYYRSDGKKIIDNKLVLETAGFIAFYIFILIIGSLLLTITSGCQIGDALYEFASAFGTVGVSNGVTSADASAGTLIVQMIGMLLGRLEIYIVFIGVYSLLQSCRRKVVKTVSKLKGA